MFGNKKISLPSWADGLLLSALGLFLTHNSWQKWADPIIDYGREVYVPWRISLGDVLYKDMAFLYGAFPPYLNALLFKIFGPSILTLAVFNLLLIAIETALIYRLFHKLFDRTTAFMAGIVFLCFFAFNQHMAQNMYYVTPYSHSYPYSLFLGFLCIYIFHNYLNAPRAFKIFGLGFCLGLMLLSRLEIFLTLLIPVAIGLLLNYRQSRTATTPKLLFSVAFLMGIYTPVIGFLIYFLKYFSLPDAFMNMIGYNPNWQQIANLHFYRFTSGFIGWQSNLKLLGITVVWYIVLFAALHMFCHGISSGIKSKQRLLPSFLVLAAIGIIGYTAHVIGTTHVSKVFRGQFLFILLMGIFYIRQLWASREKPEWNKALTIVLLSIWALFMLYKVPLFAVNYFYGRFHCLPGVMVCVAFLVYVVSNYFESKYRLGWAVRALLSTLLGIVCLTVVFQSLQWADLRYVPLSQDANRMWAYDKNYPFGEGPDVQDFLKWAEVNIKPGETFVVFPEGIMLNFLTQHKIVGPHVSFMPVEMTAYTEEAMLKPLMDNPPDYFIFANRDLSIYGKIRVGQNYGLKFGQWVNDNYTPVWSSNQNFLNREFGIFVSKLKNPKKP